MNNYPPPKRIVMLIAGTGKLLDAVGQAIRQHHLDALIVAAISHDRWGYGLLRAEREGIPAILHDLADYRATGRSDSVYSDDLLTEVEGHRPDLVMLAGWHHPLTEAFYAHFAQRLVALQSGPALLSHRSPHTENVVSRLYEAFRAGLITEASVSLQHPLPTQLRLVAESRIPIYQTDRPVDLEDRLQRAEQDLLANTLHLLLRGNNHPPLS